MQSSKLKPMNSDEPKVNHYYQDVDGNIYRVSAFEQDIETKELLVVYEPKNGGGELALPIGFWLNTTDDGQKRFSEVIVRSY